MKSGLSTGRFDVDRKILSLSIFAIISALLLIIIITLSINTSSAIRAYGAGEAFWGKAQKESAFHLSNYIYMEDEDEYKNFQNVLEIIEGDKIARLELEKDDYDYQKVYNGLLQGKNHPDDIPDMISFVRRFNWIPEVKNAIDAWERGDHKIDELRGFAANIHQVINSRNISEEERSRWVAELAELDNELTEHEIAFSSSMGRLARVVNRFLKWAIILCGLFALATGGFLIARFIKSTERWTQTLGESEREFRNVLNNSRDVIYKMRISDHKYEFVSSSLKDMLGYETNEFVEGGAEFILKRTHPEDLARMGKLVEKYNKLKNDTFLPVVEYRLKNKSGEYRWVSNARALVRDAEDNPQAIVGSVRDITEKKEQEHEIQKSLKEKEILLQEIHHRVKNNLAIISSLLELQKDSVGEDMRKLLSDSQSRIKSIAKVHEKLYESTTLSDISMGDYVTELIEEIGRAYSSEEKNITIELDVDPVLMEINQSIYCGLVLNELVNNAYKHAFTNQKTGIIRVHFKETDKGIKMMVANNGKKLPDNYDPNSGSSLGMTLVQVLSQKYKGRLEIESDEWISFTIFFEEN